ncbi:MAG TPA: hypothetical protein VH741_07415, partial [Candidatus Limnocylindrales bacterium]
EREGEPVVREGLLLRTIPLEALGALTLLLLAAALGATQPARGPEFDPPATAATPTMTTSTDDLVITLAVKPNQPGRNFVGLGVFDTRRPAPARIDNVMVQLQAPGEANADAPLLAEPLGNGRFQVAGGDLEVAGDWRITVMVRRSGMADSTATFVWTVSPLAPAPQPELVSNRPLAPILTPAAIVCAFVLGSAGAVYLGRRRTALVLARARALRRTSAPPTEKRVVQ